MTHLAGLEWLCLRDLLIVVPSLLFTGVADCCDRVYPPRFGVIPFLLQRFGFLVKVLVLVDGCVLAVIEPDGA